MVSAINFEVWKRSHAGAQTPTTSGVMMDGGIEIVGAVETPTDWLMLLSLLLRKK